MRDLGGYGLRLGRGPQGRGSVAADTGSGRVEIEGFAGPIAADTGSGSVQARGLSAVRSLGVDTGSGSVSIEGDLSALEPSASTRVPGAWTALVGPAVDGASDRNGHRRRGHRCARRERAQDKGAIWIVRMKDGAAPAASSTPAPVSVDLDFP